MTIARITQGTVDKLLSAPAPAKDSFTWDAAAPGFGVRVKGGSAKTTFVYQWRCPRSGRSCRHTIGDARKVRLADAKRAMQTLAGQIACGVNPAEERRRHRASPSFSELVAVYQRSRAWNDKAESTRRGDGYRLTTFLLPAIGHRKLSEITPTELKRLHHDLTDPEAAEALARKGGATKRTRRGGEGGARRTMRLLRAIFAYALEEGMLEQNPAASLKLGSDRAREHAPDEAAYSRLWPALARLKGRSPTMDKALAVIEVLSLTGARRGEILNLRWRHVDLDAARIVLPADAHKTGRKTGRARIIALPREAVAILRSSRTDSAAPDDLVFPGERRGRPVDLAAPWAKVKRQAGLEPALVLHSLRHGLASALAAAGRSAPEIATQLGHASWSMSQRYTHAFDRQRVELAAVAASLVRPQAVYAVS